MQTTAIRALAALGLLLAALAAPPPAAACSPVEPDPWFLGDLSADASGLPPGIELAIPDPADPSTLIITNTTGVPLIVLAALPAPGMPEPAPVARVSETFWQTWRGDRWEAGLASRQEISQPLYSDPAAAPNPRTARPADPVAPPPSRAAWAWRHADRTILVPLTITYRLNPRYDAVRSEAALKNLASFDPCGRLGALLPALACVAVPALLIAGGVAYYFHQNRSARD